MVKRVVSRRVHRIPVVPWYIISARVGQITILKQFPPRSRVPIVGERKPNSGRGRGGGGWWWLYAGPEGVLKYYLKTRRFFPTNFVFIFLPKKLTLRYE